MKLRIEIEVPDDLPSKEAEMVAVALVRFSHAVLHLGMVPSGPSPIMTTGDRQIGRAWVDQALAPSEGGAA